jgi:hypothetical protein
MICDCCDWESRWAKTSPDQVGWCSACRTYQWRRDARLHAYVVGSKADKGHGCVRCEEPWGEGLSFVWHPKCRCGTTGPPAAHALVQLTPGRIGQARCSCGWTGTGSPYRGADEDEGDLSEALLAERAGDAARWAFQEHELQLEACECRCHEVPLCIEAHADRQQQLPAPREFACEHLT